MNQMTVNSPTYVIYLIIERVDLFHWRTRQTLSELQEYFAESRSYNSTRYRKMSDNMMRRASQSNNYENVRWLRSGVAAWVIRLSRVIGIAPLVFEGSRVRISFALSLYGKFFIAAINGTSILCMILLNHSSSSELTAQEMNVKTTNFVISADTLVSFMIHVFGFLFTSDRMKSLIEVLKGVEAVKTKLVLEQTFSRTDATKKREKLFFALYFIMFLLFACFNIYVRRGPHLLTSPLYITMSVANCFIVLVVIMIEMQIVYSCRYIISMLTSFNISLQRLLDDNDGHEVIADRFQRINDNATPCIIVVSPRPLNSVAAGTLPIAISEFRPSNTTSRQLTLRQLNAIYTEISDLVDIMNHYPNGIITLLLILISAIRLIMTPYFAIILLLTKPTPVLNLVVATLWTVHHLGMAYFIIAPGQQVIEEVDEIQRTLNKLMGKALEWTDDVAVELKRLCMKCILIKPTFSPLGMFTLSRRLFVTIIGVVASYLVMVVQFRSSETTTIQNNNTSNITY